MLAMAETANDTTGKLMTQFGEFSPRGTHWTVKVSSTDRIIHIFRHYDHGTTDTDSNDWKANQGWFVYAENDERIWFYDGDQKVFLLLQLGNLGDAVRGPCDFPCPVPEDVLTKLPNTVRRAIKFRSTEAVMK